MRKILHTVYRNMRMFHRGDSDTVVIFVIQHTVTRGAVSHTIYETLLDDGGDDRGTGLNKHPVISKFILIGNTYSVKMQSQVVFAIEI